MTLNSDLRLPAEPVGSLQPAADLPLLDVVGADLSCPLATGGQTRYVNLDYAASAPALRVVAEQVSEALHTYASVHRGAGYASQVSTARYEQARATIGAFVGAGDDDVVVITRNTTDALNLLAGVVPAPGRVVVLDVEHHANLLPWQRGSHTVVPAEATLEQTLVALETQVGAEPTALVAVTGASNVTGEEVPLERVADLAHRHGARLVVDAAQLAPHRPIDMAAIGIDYLALSGHKLYAPFGAGVLVGRRDWLDAAPPYLAGGGAVRRVCVGSTDWAPAPARHEAGTPNVLGAVALAAACTALADLPEGSLARHESALREQLIPGLTVLDGVHLQRIWDDSRSSIGIVAFTVDGYEAGLVAAVLSAEHGIGVRDGKFCAHPLLDRLGLPGGAVRASVGAGSRREDVDRLLAAVADLVATGPRWRYTVVDGRWTPVAS